MGSFDTLIWDYNIETWGFKIANRAIGNLNVQNLSRSIHSHLQSHTARQPDIERERK